MALLMFAAGFALGLFFGWLLHRERVERAVYEDVARNRDRATAALAETSARLELANKDMIRLRSQLTDAEHELDERDEVIAELQQRADAAGAPGGDAVADAAGASGGDAVAVVDDWADADERADVTEEVALAATGTDDVAVAPEGDGGAEGRDTDAAEAVPVPSTGVQERLVTLLDADSEPPGPEDDIGGELTSTDQAEVGAPPPAVAAPQATESDRPGHSDVAALDAPPVAEPADAGGTTDDDLSIAGPVPDAVDRTDAAAPIAEPVVGSPDGPPSADADPTVAEDDAHVAGPVAASDAIVTADPQEPIAAEPGSPPSDAAREDETGPSTPPEPVELDSPPVGVTPDGAAADPAAGDDLRRIAGVGPALERALHAEGITTFDQIAGLDDAAIADLAARQPRLVSRLRRDGWVAQARRLQAAERPSE